MTSRAKLQLRRAEPAPAHVTPTAPVAAKTPEQGPAPGNGARRDREGKRVIAGHFSADAHRTLRRLSVDKDKTVQALLEEALEDLFAKYSV